MHGKLEKYEVNKVLIQIDHSMYGIRQSHHMLGGHGSGHIASSPGSPIFSTLHDKRGGAW